MEACAMRRVRELRDFFAADEENKMAVAAPVDLAVDPHAELAGDALRRNILGPHQRNDMIEAAFLEAVAAHAQGGFRCEAPTPEAVMDHVADFALDPAVDLLG